MKFKVSSTALLMRLQTVGRVIVSKSTLPILSTFLLEWDEERLYITATDGEIRLKSWLPLEESDGSGSICIDMRILVDGFKGLGEQTVEFCINPNNMETTVNYQTGLFRFVGQAGERFPELRGIVTDGYPLEIEASRLLHKVNSTIFATSPDEFRPVMTGIYFELADDALNTVASDGHKLILVSEKHETDEQKRSFIMTRKTGQLLKGLLGDTSEPVKLEFNKEKLRITMEGYELNAVLLTGIYPNFRAVIPKDNHIQVHLDRRSFLSVIRRMSCFSNLSSNLIKLVFEPGKIQVTAQDIDFSIAGKEEIATDYTGETLAIGFRASYLIELLNNMETAEVVLELSTPSRAALLLPVTDGSEDEKIMQLLMPMAISD